MTATTDLDCDLTHAWWRLKHARWADQPADVVRILAEFDRLLDRRLTLGGTHAGATPPPRHTTTL